MFEADRRSFQQLKELEKDGTVTRTVHAEIPPRVEYAPSAMGLALGPAVTELINWACRRRSPFGEPIDKTLSARRCNTEEFE